jgi:hypothetical protein
MMEEHGRHSAAFFQQHIEKNIGRMAAARGKSNRSCACPETARYARA